MKIQVYFKKNGLSDVEIDNEIVGINISDPTELVVGIVNNGYSEPKDRGEKLENYQK